MPLRVRALIVAVLLAATVALVPSTQAAPPELQLLSDTSLSPRLHQLRVFSPAMGRELNVRVLTPDGFDASRDHLPVLWLLHGGFGQAADWTTVGRAEELTAGLPLVVVMPDAGTGGWYSNWKNATGEGPQQWETFHLQELRPFLEARYQTRTDRSGRAVAGLSMGGFGAMHYASRHPDLFGFAASFSGAVDIAHLGVDAVVAASPLAHQGLPLDLYGDRVTEESRWRANNPVDLAANLRTVQLEMRTGNGMPGGRHGGGYDVIEIGVSQATYNLHARLAALGIDHLYDDYGPGAHTWEYWADDLQLTLPSIMAATAEVRPDPATVEHVALEPHFDVWGHTVDLDRPVLEEAVLGVRPDGFDVRGSGTGTVTTPARFAPGSAVQVTTAGDTGSSTTTVVADSAGRVTVPVDLGAPNLVDAYPLETYAGPPASRSVHVTLAA